MSEEQKKLRELEKENKQLRMENDGVSIEKQTNSKGTGKGAWRKIRRH